MVTRSEIYALFYGGDVLSKLVTARDLYGRYGKVLAVRPEIMAHMAAVQGAERDLQTRMGAMRMGVTCSRCAARAGGGCCSRFMAGENDVLQLLMNMLAGVQVASQQEGISECCFLGGQGCILTLKSMFCLNYICCHIKDQENGASLLLLEQRTGDLLRKQGVLEGLLLEFFCENL